MKRVRIFSLVVLALLALALVVPGVAAAYTAQETEFIALLNQYRVAQGLEPLLVSDTISVASRKHNQDMAKYAFFSHYSEQSDYYAVGSAPWDRMRVEGYGYNTYMGENIAAGYADAASVFQGWKNSAGHNANMLNVNYTVVGISFIEVPGSPYRYYWTTDFGGYTDSSAHSLAASAPAPDRELPAVSFGLPADGATVSAGSAVAIAVNATDNVGVTKVELRVDGKLAATDSSLPYTFTWDTKGVAAGQHTLTATAYDAAGNSAAAEVRVTVATNTTTTTVKPTTTTVKPTTTTTMKRTTTTMKRTTTSKAKAVGRTTTTTTARAASTPTTTTTTTPPAATTTTTLPSATTTTARQATTTTQVAAPVAPVVFIDLAEDDPYYEAVCRMKQAAVVDGYPAGEGIEFRPEAPVLRAQFAKMLCGALGIWVAEEQICTFTDLLDDCPDNLYPHDYIAAAAAAGIIRGLPNGAFGPWEEISRSNLVAMVVRAMEELQPGLLLTPPSDYEGSFSPTGWTEQDVYLRSAEYNGLLAGLKGFGPTWNPWQSATRGEVAHILVNLLDLSSSDTTALPGL